MGRGSLSRSQAAGLKTAYISNGNGTPEVIDYLRPWVDLYKVDLKSFRDRNYRKLGGRLDGVLDTIQRLYQKGFWLEVVTLIIPGFNDSSEELSDIAAFLADISPDIPWHVTAFHKDYRMTDPDNTSVATLIGAAEIGDPPASLRVCREYPRSCWRLGEYELSLLQHAPHRTPWFPCPTEPPPEGRLSQLSIRHSRSLELASPENRPRRRARPRQTAKYDAESEHPTLSSVT